MENPPVKRIKIYAIILALFFLEVTVLGRITLLGARPNLLLIATLFFGFYFGPARGIEAGLVAGILKDISGVSVFGINTFSLVLVGFLASLPRNKIFKDNFFTQFFFAAVLAFFYYVLYFVYPGNVSGFDGVRGWFWRIAFCGSIYTGIAAPFLFLVFTKILRGKGIDNI